LKIDKYIFDQTVMLKFVNYWYSVSVLHFWSSAM